MSASAAKAGLVKILVPAARATPTPPLGPALGQRGVKSMDFCKQFNDRTKNIEPDAPIPTVITINPDRTFTFITKTPPTVWFLKRAAGIEKCSPKAKSVIVGKVTLKHIYEIAKVKQTDLSYISLESICKTIVAQARGVGIEVVH